MTASRTGDEGVQRPAEGIRRLLFLVRSDGVGGVERVVATLVPVLRDLGVEVTVAVLEDAPSAILGSACDPVVLAAPRAPAPVRRIAQTIELRRRLRAGAFDAVIARGPNANAVAALAGWRTGLPVAVTETGDPFIARRRRWNRMFWWTYRCATTVVVLTEELADEMRRSGHGFPQVTVVPNPVADAVPVVDAATTRDRVIVGVGRFVAGKRFADLIDVLAELRARDVTWEQWKLVILGDGPERAALERRAADLGLSGVVELPGFVDAPWEHLARAPFMLHAAEAEGFGNVLVEAMASGCAVVAASCRFGPRALIRDGANGVLVPVGDVDAFASAVQRLERDPTERERMARAGAATAGEHDARAVARRWLDLLGREARCRTVGVEAPGTPSTGGREDQTQV